MTAVAGPSTRSSVRRVFDVAGAFLWMGWLTTSAYPLSFLMTQIATLVPAFIYYFVAELVGPRVQDVGTDYYTFVMLGVLSLRMLSGGLTGLSEELEETITEGRLEALLVQPVRWRLLPFGLVQWPIVWRLGNAVLLILLTALLGARYDLSGALPALLVVALGLGASTGVGILAAAVKLLARRTEPVITLYVIAVTVLSGVFYPVSSLPAPVQVISYLLPDTYVIAALRKLLMPGGESLPGPGTGTVIVGLLAFNLMIYPLALWLFGRSLAYGRRMGLLGG